MRSIAAALAGTLTVTGGGGGTQFAEDAAHTTGDLGTMSLAVRNDAGTALAGATGDYIPLSTDSSGSLRVTGAGGGTQYVEDAASAGGETMTLAGAIRQDTITTSTTTDGDFSNLKVNAQGALYTAGTVTVTGVMSAAEVRATTGAAPTAFTATTSTQVFASNANRKLFTVYNNSDKDLYLMLASAAVSATSYHVIVKANGGFFQTADYSGEIRGIMAATITTGQVNPGEFT